MHERTLELDAIAIPLVVGPHVVQVIARWIVQVKLQRYALAIWK